MRNKYLFQYFNNYLKLRSIEVILPFGRITGLCLFNRNNLQGQLQRITKRPCDFKFKKYSNLNITTIFLLKLC